MNIIILSLITFSLTILITKSKILAGKREFVEKRYQAAKVDGQKPSMVHSVWRAIWNCPMCCGWWIALISSIFLGFDFLAVICAFGINWLLQCLEDFLFQLSKLCEKIFKSLDNHENEV